MTKFEKFREAVMEYSIVPLIIAMVLCIANIAVSAFTQTEVMWLLYLTVAVLILVAVYGLAFLVCFFVGRYVEYKEYKAYREDEED